MGYCKHFVAYGGITILGMSYVRVRTFKNILPFSFIPILGDTAKKWPFFRVAGGIFQS